MTNIQVLPIRTARERRHFLTFPWKIYKNDPLWVPPLMSERAKTIDPRIKTRCIGCPPDQHPDNYWCAWEFSIS